MTRVISLLCVLAAGVAPGATAQTPGPTAPAPPKAEAQPPAAYSYDPASRRDPFISLLGRGSDGRAPGQRPSGIPGLLINEISIKGIVKDRTGYLALIQGPDNRPHVLRPGDKLYDGTVQSILADAVLFSQDVNDPLSLIKQREIRKPLRSNQEGR